MKEPVHPGEQVKLAIRGLGLGMAEAGRRIGVTRQTVHALVAGRARITPAMALRLEKSLGGSADMWLDLEGRYALADARRRLLGAKAQARPAHVESDALDIAT